MKNIVFAGTPEFAAAALEALLRAGHTVSLVLTQPDRPAGRGRKLRASAVKRFALSHGLPILQPGSLKEAGIVSAIEARHPDVMVVAAYGLIVPAPLLSLPRLGCINIHASLLPRWRGAAPIQRALLAGDAETGITIMLMDEGLDTGAILLQEAIPIRPGETAQTLHDRLADLGGRLIVRALREPLRPRVQDIASATYAAKVDQDEALIDWSEPADAIDRKVRAFNPAPGAYTTLDGMVVKIWAAAVERGVRASPGVVCASTPAGIVVACGVDALRLLEVQRAGGKRLAAQAFARGAGMAPGARMGA